jgi:hypothetical protein
LVRDYALLGVRRLQGRSKEMEPTVRRLVAEHPGLSGLRAIAAAFYCEIGRESEARPLLDEAVRTSFDGVRWDVNWVTTMTAYAYAAARLRERRGAGILYSRLIPQPGRCPADAPRPGLGTSALLFQPPPWARARKRGLAEPGREGALGVLRLAVPPLTSRRSGRPR